MLKLVWKELKIMVHQKYTLSNYNRDYFKRDLIAGLTLFVMLVPQGMAYAMLAGLPPVMGLYASTIPLIIYALFASSRHLSVGPVAITSLLVFSGIATYAEPETGAFVSVALSLTILTGIIQLLLGFFRAGFIITYISPAVLGGYTSAAAIVIGLSQLQHLIGINVGNYLQVHLLLLEVAKTISQIHLPTLAIGLISIVFLLAIKNAAPRIPGALLIVLISIAIVYFFQLHTHGVNIVGNVPKGFPTFQAPVLSLELIWKLLPVAITIAILGFMESFAIGKSIAEKEDYAIRPNRELKALGLANVVGSFFQSYPINGSFSRSAVNHQAGGATQLTSVITAVCVFITLLFFTSFFLHLPNAVLAAIIMAAVYKLINVSQLASLWKARRPEGWSWIVTFILTLTLGIQWGIILGVVFSLVLRWFVKK